MLFFRKFSKKAVEPVMENLPEHIAIIMDGNGRWAKKRGLPRSVGHREGSESLKRIINYCNKIEIKYLTVYAFSTENWRRPKDEVDSLMKMFNDYLKDAEKDLIEKNIRLRIVGKKESLPDDMRKRIAHVENISKKNTGLCFNIAWNYGGREELIHAVKEIAGKVNSKKISINDIDEELVSKCLYTYDIPDPDLLIRTSGESRISNFLLWQSAYTEFLFTDVLWPDFKEENLMEGIIRYQNRKRRFGGI